MYINGLNLINIYLVIFVQSLDHHSRRYSLFKLVRFNFVFNSTLDTNPLNFYDEVGHLSLNFFFMAVNSTKIYSSY